ncbi:MAG: hypothetical protein RIS99_176 [Bacteroidota bacterium]|jgi:hypothetical protein
METIVNKVTASGIITLDLARFLPEKPILSVDLSSYLWQGMVLKEKDFREVMGATDWTIFQHEIVAVYCSTDAIVPTWAFMLLAGNLQQAGAQVFFGTTEHVRNQILLQNINQMDVSSFEKAKVVVKGCGDESISEAAYVAITLKLKPVVKILMYGEPCSTVPLFKRKE